MNHTLTADSNVAVEDPVHRASLTRRFFGVIGRPQSYRNMAYLFLGLPLGTVWFTALVTGFTVGISLLVVALVGIPVLVGLWYVTRAIANVERSIANTLLGYRLAAAPINALSGNPWVRLRAMSA